jgi:hypothetical protein
MFWKSKKEEKVTKPVEKVEPKVEPKAEPKKPSFYEVVSNHLYMRTSSQRWGNVNRIDNISGGVRISLDVNPAYLFPQPLRTNVGTLVIGEYRSDVSHISVSFNISDDYGHYRDYNRDNRYDGYYDNRYISNDRGYGPNGLSVDRQVYLNSDYDFVSQNNELILSEQSVRINIPFRSNIRISSIHELDSRILSVLEEAKKSIVQNFQKEIHKSKSEIIKKEFNSKITNELVTDTFQHVIDLVNGSEVRSSNGGKVFFVPMVIVVGDNGSAFDLEQKEIDIFYELMEGSARIKGEYDVFTKINFMEDGIYLQISPKQVKYELIKDEEEKRREYSELMRRRYLENIGGMRQAVIRDPYRDLGWG